MRVACVLHVCQTHVSHVCHVCYMYVTCVTCVSRVLHVCHVCHMCVTCVTCVSHVCYMLCRPQLQESPHASRGVSRLPGGLLPFRAAVRARAPEVRGRRRKRPFAVLFCASAPFPFVFTVCFSSSFSSPLLSSSLLSSSLSSPLFARTFYHCAILRILRFTVPFPPLCLLLTVH